MSSLSERIAAQERRGLCHYGDCTTPTGSDELGYCEPHLRIVNAAYRRPASTVARLADERRLPAKVFA